MLLDNIIYDTKIYVQRFTKYKPKLKLISIKSLNKSKNKNHR